MTAPNVPLEVGSFTAAAGTNRLRINRGQSATNYLELADDGNAVIRANGITNTAGGITFEQKTNSAESFSERMRIDGVGNVGIGTSAPTAKLHVSSITNNAFQVDTRPTAGATLVTGLAVDAYGRTKINDLDISGKRAFPASSTWIESARFTLNAWTSGLYHLVIADTAADIANKTVYDLYITVARSGGNSSAVWSVVGYHQNPGQSDLAVYANGADVSIYQYNGTWGSRENTITVQGVSGANGITYQLYPNGSTAVGSFSGTKIESTIPVSFGVYGGNVGIGTASPVGKLSISSTTTGNLALKVDAKDYNGTMRNNAFVVNASGNVGIGTAASGAKLEVVGEVRSAVKFSLFPAGDQERFAVSLNASGVAMTGMNGPFEIYNGYGDWGAGAGAIKFSVHTRDVASGLTGGVKKEAMRINYIGNVGIGATVPGASLHVASTTTGNLAMKVDAKDYNGTMQNNALTVSPSGNVGMGTSAPTAKLVVSDLNKYNAIIVEGPGAFNINGSNFNVPIQTASPWLQYGITKVIMHLSPAAAGFNSNIVETTILEDHDGSMGVSYTLLDGVKTASATSFNIPNAGYPAAVTLTISGSNLNVAVAGTAMNSYVRVFTQIYR
jgi:hypothetical protein